jgi:hypothetical protein
LPPLAPSNKPAFKLSLWRNFDAARGFEASPNEKQPYRQNEKRLTGLFTHQHFREYADCAEAVKASAQNEDPTPSPRILKHFETVTYKNPSPKGYQRCNANDNHDM